MIIISEDDVILVDEFTDEMIKILAEKLPKYKDTWKTVPIGLLREKMDEQLKKISDIMITNAGNVKQSMEELRRRIVHVGVYSSMIYYRFGEL